MKRVNVVWSNIWIKKFMDQITRHHGRSLIFSNMVAKENPIRELNDKWFKDEFSDFFPNIMPHFIPHQKLRCHSVVRHSIMFPMWRESTTKLIMRRKHRCPKANKQKNHIVWIVTKVEKCIVDSYGRECVLRGGRKWIFLCLFLSLFSTFSSPWFSSLSLLQGT